MNNLIHGIGEGTSEGVSPKDWEQVEENGDDANPDQDENLLKTMDDRAIVTLKKPKKKKKNPASGRILELNRSPMNEQTGYGGDPQKVPTDMNTGGHKSDSTKEYRYAPGDSGMTTARVNPLVHADIQQTYQENTGNDQPTDDAGYTEHESDSNFSNKTRPRPAPKNDKDMRLDRMKHPSGLPEPPPLVDVGMGNMVYPLDGSIKAGDTVTRVVEDQASQTLLTYTWTPQGNKYPTYATVQAADLQEPGGMENKPDLVLVLDPTTAQWVKSDESANWVPKGENWPAERLAEVEKVIMDNIPDELVKAQEKADERKRREYNVLKDPALEEIVPDMTDEEKVFTTITQWDDNVFYVDTAKLDAATLDIIKETPKSGGKHKYFKWLYTSKEQVAKRQAQDIEDVGFTTGEEADALVVEQLPAWKKAAPEVAKLRRS